MERGLNRSLPALLAVTLVGLTLVPRPIAAQQPHDRRVVILRPAEGDGRVASAYEAIAFWNQVLSDLHLPTRLVETTLVATTHGGRVLENYTRQVWQQAGRLLPEDLGPEEPSALASLGADIVLFLSAQPTMSFAWPLRELPGHFVAIPAERVTRNVIAHELGHALGLTHHNDPRVLMCSPCGETETLPPGSFLPVTDADRQRLQELYSATP